VNARAVILAAGRGRRMGGQKLLMAFRERPLIKHVIDAASTWEPLVVASPELDTFLQESGAQIVLNDAPEKGMSHSLKLADRAIDPSVSILVLLADKPLVTNRLLRRVFEAAGGADVAYPQRGDEPGHPVYFSPKARANIRRLPPGDSLSRVRDDSKLVRRPLHIDDDGAFFDVDTPGALLAFPE